MHAVEYSDRVEFISDESEGAAGEILAEVTFPTVEPGIADINHTFVDPSLRGQGVAGELLNRAVAIIERDGKRARATCPYAIHWFEKHPERADLLA